MKELIHKLLCHRAGDQCRYHAIIQVLADTKFNMIFSLPNAQLSGKGHQLMHKCTQGQIELNIYITQCYHM